METERLFLRKYRETEFENLKGKKGMALSFGIAKLYRRQGLISEAVKAVITHLFAVEGVEYVSAGYLTLNEPSQQLQNKLGFSYLSAESFGEGEAKVTVIKNILWRDGYGF